MDAIGMEDDAFPSDDVYSILKESADGAIGSSDYQRTKVGVWTSAIVQQSLSQLSKIEKPFKYIVTCMMMQKTGAGFHTASSCYWDNTADDSCTVKWENNSMYCVISAFGLTL